MKFALLITLGLAASTATAQQKPIGSVATADADVSNGAGGMVSVSAGRATLTGNSTVTAKNHSAELALTRGGKVRICQTSGLHVMQSEATSLLLALDRGALELRMKIVATDTLLTPDLRLTPMSAGSLDLDLRVARNGDTCVDNRGRNAPSLSVVDAYGQATYILKPGQHVLFEHGSTREVVDRETVPCGCPPEEKAIPLAEALLRGGPGKVTPKQAAAANPFPAAVSEGLAEPTPLPPEIPGGTHVQVATTITYDPTAKRAPLDGTDMPTVTPAATPAIDAESKANPLRTVGRFFKRLFVR